MTLMIKRPLLNALEFACCDIDPPVAEILRACERHGDEYGNYRMMLKPDQAARITEVVTKALEQPRSYYGMLSPKELREQWNGLMSQQN